MSGRVSPTGWLLLTLAATCLGTPMMANAQSAPLQPSQMVRSLQLVQDRVAAGDHAALPMQRKLLSMIDARLREGTAQELGEAANFRASLVYAMSGGNPKTLEFVLERLDLGEEDSRKAIGILTYLNGGMKAASIALKPVDPMKEPVELGAFLALVKGSLAALEDPEGALKLLDQARLLSPGTLIEEAALRRSIPLAAQTHDGARLILASEQYVRSYLRSPYASQFADGFVSGVVALQETIDLDAVATVIGLMSPEQEYVIYLRLARRAAIDGLTRLSQFAAERTKIIEATANAADDPRALLYASLAGVATAPLENLQADLSRIDRAKLSPGDLKLLDAVTAVSGQMSAKPMSPAPTMASGMDGYMAAGPMVIDSPPFDPEIPQTAENLRPKSEPAKAASAQPAMASAQQPAPAAEADQPTTAPVKAAEAAEAPAPKDPAELMVSAGRKKLDEIDELLAKAAK